MLRHRCYPKDVKISLYEGNVLEVVEKENYTKPRANSKKAKSLKMVIDGNTTQQLICITECGKAYTTLTNDVMCGKCKLEFDSPIAAIISKSDKPYIIIGTKNGIVKRTKVDDIISNRKSGKICIKLKNDNKVCGAVLAADNENVAFISSDKKGYQCKIEELGLVGAIAAGYKGINLNADAALQSIAIVDDNKYKVAHLGAKGNKV